MKQWFPSFRLDKIFERYMFLVKFIGLKLDVEGFEKSVLESWKNSRIPPWVLVD